MVPDLGDDDLMLDGCQQQLRLGIDPAAPHARVVRGPSDVSVLKPLVEVGEARGADHAASRDEATDCMSQCLQASRVGRPLMAHRIPSNSICHVFSRNLGAVHIGVDNMGATKIGPDCFPEPAKSLCSGEQKDLP